MTSFRSALKRGMSPADAGRHVTKHHFDYLDLTELERIGLRRLIPYYTFMSRRRRHREP